MDAWIWWLAVAGALGLVEVATTTLVFAMLAGGGAAAALSAGLGGGTVIQVVAFVVVSLALLGLVRPIARRHLMATPETRTGVAALVGRTATVVARVDGRDGRVKIGGEVWSARAYDGESSFEIGQQVDVALIDGATALVL